jgi:hypothetical protein
MHVPLYGILETVRAALWRDPSTAETDTKEDASVPWRCLRGLDGGRVSMSHSPVRPWLRRRVSSQTIYRYRRTLAHTHLDHFFAGT